MKVKTTKLNKDEQRYQQMYLDSNDYSLFDVYESVSRKKWEAWEHCEAVCRECAGWNLKVLSYNSWQFTAGFKFENPAISLYIITKSREFAFEEWFNTVEEV